MKCYSAIKKSEVLSFAAAWMDLKNTMLHELSPTEKDRNCMIIIYMRNPKLVEMNVYARQKQTHRYKK